MNAHHNGIRTPYRHKLGTKLSSHRILWMKRKRSFLAIDSLSFHISLYNYSQLLCWRNEIRNCNPTAIIIRTKSTLNNLKALTDTLLATYYCYPPSDHLQMMDRWLLLSFRHTVSPFGPLSGPADRSTGQTTITRALLSTPKRASLPCHQRKYSPFCTWWTCCARYNSPTTNDPRRRRSEKWIRIDRFFLITIKRLGEKSQQRKKSYGLISVLCFIAPEIVVGEWGRRFLCDGDDDDTNGMANSRRRHQLKEKL